MSEVIFPRSFCQVEETHADSSEPTSWPPWWSLVLGVSASAGSDSKAQLRHILFFPIFLNTLCACPLAHGLAMPLQSRCFKKCLMEVGCRARAWWR